MKKTPSWNILLLAMILVSSTLMAGCGLNSNTPKKAKVTTVVRVAANPLSSQSLIASTKAVFHQLVLGPNARLSFTPTHLKVKIKSLSITSDTTEIQVSGPTPEIDLIGHDPSEDILKFIIDVPENLFGDYNRISLNYGDESNLLGNGSLAVSGSVTLDGTTHNFSDLFINMGTGGVALEMVTPVPVNDTTNPVVKIIFDTENCAFLALNSHTPGTTYLPGHDPAQGGDGLAVVIDDLLFLPYAGTGDPTINKYKVRFTGITDYGDPAYWYIKVITVQDPQGNLVEAGWQVVFENGYTNNSPAIQPKGLRDPLITQNVDGSYQIIHDPNSYNMVPLGARLEFPAFMIYNDNNSHNGTLTYGGTNYNYTVVKYN